MSNGRVLLVDDDPIGRRFLGDALSALGLAVTACSDVTGALDAAVDAPFDLLVVDLRLPDGSGIECLRRLRDRPGCAAAPAMALSAELDAATRADALAAGFDDVAAKPLSIDELGRRIRPLLPGALLDDGEGLRAAGSADNLAILRQLLARELPGQLDAIDAAIGRGETDTVGAIVHRVRGAAAFCGATALAAAAEALAAAARGNSGALRPAQARLRQVAGATLRRLD